MRQRLGCSHLLFSLFFLTTSSALMAGPADGDLTELYREPAGRILGAAMTDDEGWQKLEYLTTVIGNRLSGSVQLEEGIEWAVAGMTGEGLENVRAQPVTVRHWVRGEESAEMIRPARRSLAILGLGGSVATPAEGIEAPVVVVESFDELDSLDDEAIAGKIVLFAVPWLDYRQTVQYRSNGASRAAARGAVAALVRSATSRSLYTPHTGALRYNEDVPKIPAAAVTVEDSEWMRRLAGSGTEIEVRLQMAAQSLPDAQSANVIAEIVGSEKPEEVVVMGGHFDSWDVGQGAHDDGAACIAAWQALTLLKRLGLRPRRTLRVVLWTNEENGLAGGRAYRAALGDQVSEHVAAIEMDGGAERPIGFGFSMLGVNAEDGDPVHNEAMAKLRQLARLLDGIDAGTVEPGGFGADIMPLMRDGVPGLSVRTVMEHYFDWHHTHADTLDKVDPQNLRKAVAMFGIFGYALADMPERLTPAAR